MSYILKWFQGVQKRHCESGGKSNSNEECNEGEAKNERPVDNQLLQKDKERERKVELILHRFFPGCEKHGVGEEERDAVDERPRATGEENIRRKRECGKRGRRGKEEKKKSDGKERSSYGKCTENSSEGTR